MYFKFVRALYIKKKDYFKIAQNYTKIISKMKGQNLYNYFLRIPF